MGGMPAASSSSRGTRCSLAMASSLLKRVAQVGRIDQRRLIVDGACDLPERKGEHKFSTGQAQRTVEGAASPRHDHFLPETRRIWKLPDILGVAPRNAGGGRRRHRAGSTGSDHTGLRSRQFRQPSTHSALKIEEVNEMPGCFQLRSADLRPLE